MTREITYVEVYGAQTGVAVIEIKTFWRQVCSAIWLFQNTCRSNTFSRIVESANRLDIDAWLQIHPSITSFLKLCFPHNPSTQALCTVRGIWLEPFVITHHYRFTLKPDQTFWQLCILSNTHKLCPNIQLETVLPS